MSEQPPKQEEVVTVPPRKPKKGNRTILIVIGVIVGLLIVGSLVAVAIGWLALNKASDSIKDVVEQTQEQMEQDANSGEDETNSRPAIEPSTLPEDYPVSEAPIYSPSAVTYASKMGAGWMVIVETSDSLDEVAKTIADTYERLGSAVNQDPINDKGVGQIVTSSGGYGIVATYSFNDDKKVTNITYDVSPQRQ